MRPKLDDIPPFTQDLGTESLPVDLSLSSEIRENSSSGIDGILTSRTVIISLIAIVVALAASICAKVLVLLIALVTNISFHGRFSFGDASPWDHHLGWWVVLVPAVGGLLVGFAAKYGSRAIRGHGIPEAMEQVLTNGSRIAPRVTLLKPVSSAIAIGTGGPFGAEGPIIATGGALGSLFGQLLRTTGLERKILLASGAAAGMTAIFGSPVAAVVLAVELLLFELRPQSLIPVALAASTAAGCRWWLFEHGPVFKMANLGTASGEAIATYVVLGLLIGVVATVVTRLVYRIEDTFEKLPIHWMWWPAIGGLVVGLVGYFEPRTLGVGYSNISEVLTGNLAGVAVLTLACMKFISWSIALGSGTSGGTLAPLLTIGGGLGAVLGELVVKYAPHLGVDTRVAALVGMAALFAGASRALLTSVVFAFETTQQPASLLPLLAGCTAAYLVSCLLMRNTIMTEKIARRGIKVPSEFIADHLAHVTLGQYARKRVVTISASDDLSTVREWLRKHGRDSEHQGFPVTSGTDLVGVVTRRNLLDPAISDRTTVADLVKKPAVTIEASATLRDAADEMVRHGIGRLPILDPTGRLVGIVTRSDLLAAHQPRLHEHEHVERTIKLRAMLRRRRLKRAS